ncbi:hypothetical protein AUH73_03580 [archaeon 13_1_40CM_4_53_4]|nr:MAG: hypothetical protein AUH73_03580 [archaeon 13_1_40CM_4_53_4]
MKYPQNRVRVVERKKDGARHHEHSTDDEDLRPKTVVLDDAAIEGEAGYAPLDKKCYAGDCKGVAVQEEPGKDQSCAEDYEARPYKCFDRRFSGK